MATATPLNTVTLFQLHNSRALRIAWLLEELHLPYTIVTGTRLPNFDPSPEWKAQAGGMGKSPTIHDGELIIQESGAIVDYLCETYPSPDPSIPLLPPPSTPHLRAKVREAMHLAEGLFLLHAYPVFASRRLSAEIHNSPDVAAFRSAIALKVFDDMDWLERQLQSRKASLPHPSQPLFLIGTNLTAADIMMGFSAQLIMNRIVKSADMIPESREYPVIEEWLGELMRRPALRKAIEKTGFTG